MKKEMKTLLLAAVAIGLAVCAHAAPEVKLGGLLFAQATDITSPRNFAGADASGRTSFDVTRLYVIADAKFDEHWKSRFIVEANTIGGQQTITGGVVSNNKDANNSVFLKQAWLEYSNLLDAGVNIQGGQIGTSWDSLEISIWGRRYIQKQYADINGLVPTADKGVGVYGKIPKGYGDYSAQIVNGEGIAATEAASGAAGRQKDYSLLLSLIPVPQSEYLKGLRLNGYVQQGQTGNLSTTAGQGLLPNRERNRTFFGASYKNDTCHLMYTYYIADTGVAGTTQAAALNTKSRGYSVHGSYALPWFGLSPFARYDRFDAGTMVDYAPQTLVIGGLEKKFNDNVRMSLADQYRHSQSGAFAGSLTKVSSNENVLGVYAEAKF
jgi:hypothetical protein